MHLVLGGSDMIDDSDLTSAFDELRDWLGAGRSMSKCGIRCDTNVCKVGCAGKGHVSNYLSRGIRVCGSLGISVLQFSPL